jgi:hypothetical protein
MDAKTGSEIMMSLSPSIREVIVSKVKDKIIGMCANYNITLLSFNFYNQLESSYDKGFMGTMCKNSEPLNILSWCFTVPHHQFTLDSVDYIGEEFSRGIQHLR